MGTRQIQDGCRVPGKLQHVFKFLLDHGRDIYLMSTQKPLRMTISTEQFIIISDYVKVIKFQNGRHFHYKLQKSSIT